MTTSSRQHRTSTLVLGAAIAACALLLGLACAERADAYTRPAGGKWQFRNLFDDTKTGKLKLSKRGTKVRKLVLVPGADQTAACGEAPIRLARRPRVRRFKKANGRFAVARIKGGLFTGKGMRFKQGGQHFRARLELLWDETGRLVDTGRFDHGDCHLGFFATKGG